MFCGILLCNLLQRVSASTKRSIMQCKILRKGHSFEYFTLSGTILKKLTTLLSTLHGLLMDFLIKNRSLRNKLYSKGKAVSLQTWSGPEGSRNLRFPDYMTTVRDGGKFSFTHRPPLSPRKYSWYSFLLEAESTPVP